MLAEVFAGLAEPGGLAAALPGSASAEHRAPTTEDLATLRPAVLRRLDESEGLLAGTGVIAGDGSFFAVAAADIGASDFERTVLPLPESEGGATLLVNACGRVVAPNPPQVISGSLAPAEDPEAVAPACRLPLGADWADCVGLPWSLVRV